LPQTILRFILPHPPLYVTIGGAALGAEASVAIWSHWIVGTDIGNIYESKNLDEIGALMLS
jgi:hypothetical protein